MFNKKYDENLKAIDLGINQINKMNWEWIPQGLRENLDVIDLWCNRITKLSWEGCHWNLKIYPEEYQEEFEKYKAATRIQRVWLRKYTKRKYAAKVITDACHNWIWKPLCKDGTIGIRPRLDILALDEYLT